MRETSHEIYSWHIFGESIKQLFLSKSRLYPYQPLLTVLTSVFTENRRAILSFLIKHFLQTLS